MTDADPHAAALAARIERAHEIILRARGWRDEAEAATDAAVNYGDGVAAERAHWHRTPGTYRTDEATEVVVDLPESLSWLEDEFPDEVNAIADAERARILGLLPRFLHGEMFDATPEDDLDLDASALAMTERFRAIVNPQPPEDRR